MATSHLKEEREIQAYDPRGRRQRPVACLSSSHGQRGHPMMEGDVLFWRGCLTMEAFWINSYCKAPRKHNIIFPHLPLFSAHTCLAEEEKCPLRTGDP